MVSADQRENTSAISPETEAEMGQYGITRVPVDYYCLGQYRYTNLQDAVAQAKRQQRPE